jgi:hypothetical protein
LGTPVRDHGEAIEQEEQEGTADGDNGVGEECIKWEIDGKRRQRGTRKSDNSATGTRFLLGQVGR